MKENNSGNIPFYTALAVMFIFIVLGLTYMIQNSNSYDERGTFGDMFGFANALFTGVSFIGLIVTILLQRQDLNIQKEELQKQTEVTRVQNFENTFFHMISLFNNVIENTEINLGGETGRITGRSAMSQIHYELLTRSQKFHAFIIKSSWDPTVAEFYFTKEEIRDICNAHFNRYRNQLSHYYDTLFNIFQIIDENKFINQNLYINILQSQLSSLELNLLFYYVLFDNEEVIFKKYIEKYCFFKRLNLKTIIFPDLLSEYEASAYFQ